MVGGVSRTPRPRRALITKMLSPCWIVALSAHVVLCPLMPASAGNNCIQSPHLFSCLASFDLYMFRS